MVELLPSRAKVLLMVPLELSLSLLKAKTRVEQRSTSATILLECEGNSISSQSVFRLWSIFGFWKIILYLEARANMMKDKPGHINAGCCYFEPRRLLFLDEKNV
jgi:hypothetical protein